jgi:hypothetical protein
MLQAKVAQNPVVLFGQSAFFFCDISRVVRDISHFRPFGVEHVTIDNELVLDLDSPVLKRRGGAIRKRLWALELLCPRWT